MDEYDLRRAVELSHYELLKTSIGMLEEEEIIPQ